jgi:hypothetical protein
MSLVTRTAAAALFVGIVAAVPAGATNAHSELQLKGGDQLQANAYHCGTYFRNCSWTSSAKLLGTTPRRAKWIQNNAKVEGHGPSAKITIGKSSNVEVTFKSKTLFKTRWRNGNAFISDSSGKAHVSLTTLWVSTESLAYASHKSFGKPGPVRAYAGAL